MFLIQQLAYFEIWLWIIRGIVPFTYTEITYYTAKIVFIKTKQNKKSIEFRNRQEATV
jgi:hypothetical protein